MTIEAKYDPLLFKLPKGVITKSTNVKFDIQYSGDEPERVYFMVKSDEDLEYQYLEMQKTQNGYSIEHFFEFSGHFWYNFQIILNGNCFYLNKTPDFRSALSSEKGEDFLQLVTSEEYKCTNSMQGGIIYQIFVDRFCKIGEVKERSPLVLRRDWGGAIKKNTDDPLKINLEVFGGNIKGITSKLDYIKELGTTKIYLSPISQANSNHKYNTADYMKIDDMFGTEEDFKELVNEAQKRDIGIVIDGVYNHTGSDSIYFDKESRFRTLGAFESRESQLYDWYEFEEFPNKYKCWWGINTLPSINRNSEDFQDFIAGDRGVLEKYLNLGISGVRLDVVDEITDKFVKKIEKKIHEFGKDKVVLGEVWEDAAIKQSYGKRRKYFANNELNSVMNYPFKESILDYIKTKNTFSLESKIRMLENNYPKVVKDNLMNFLTTHDTKRVFSELVAHFNNDEEIAKKVYKIALVLLYTLPGVPSIFYGDEYGMQDNDGSSRGCFDWKAYKNDIYEFVLKLSKIRQLSVFKDGEIKVLNTDDGQFSFERVNGKERVIVITNLSNNPLGLNFNGNYIDFFTGQKAGNQILNENEFRIIIEK